MDGRIAAMVKVGALVVIEDNFVSGSAAQQRWRVALDGTDLGWVGVRCDPAVAAQRERDRGDWVLGMAAKQALTVHAGTSYDLEVDTSTHGPEAVARLIRQPFFE